MSDFADKLGDLLLGGVGSIAGALVPDHLLRQAKARLSDFNPFDIIRGNHDLTRAVRLAWIEAALKVLEAARASQPGPRAGPLHDFIATAERNLRTMRQEAWDRRGDVGWSPIDRHVEAVLSGTPAFIAPGVDPARAEPLTKSFAATLAAVSGWPTAEVPALPGQIAEAGLLTIDGGAARSFGELVFAAFAELLKDPKKYPEAGPAFSIALQDAARKLAQDALVRLDGVDDRLDTVLSRLDASGVIEAGAAAYLALLPRLAEGQAQLQRTMDMLATSQAAEADLAALRHAELLATLAGERGVPLAALQAQIARLGEANVPFEKIEARLDTFVTEFLKLKEDLARPTNADPEVAATRARALALLNDGDLDAARVLFVTVLAKVRERRQQASSEEAILLADRARIDMMQVRYPDAIAAYEEAADLVRFDAEAARGYLQSLAVALTDQGREFGDNAALHSAIEILRAKVLLFISRALTPLDWAMAQNELGIALTTLGERESGTALLEEAVIAYRAALQEWTRERVPTDWAATQNNLGNALSALGWRESGTARLEEAVAAYRAALEEGTRERVPRDWAMAQNNLGNALRRLGDRESGTARLEEAVVAYRTALDEWNRKRMPLDWAMTQNNLGTALSSLGEREGGTARLEEAVVAHRAALEERTRERVPLEWAGTQNNLGNALSKLGERDSGTARLEEAVVSYRAALKEWTRERVPLDWAATQNNLGNALATLGERDSAPGRLEEAVVSYRAALKEWTRERVPLRWAMTQNNLGNAMMRMARLKSEPAHLKEAVIAYRRALQEGTRERVPLDWATTQNNLGAALSTLGEWEGGTARLEEATIAYRAALKERTRERVPLYWAMTQNNLGIALMILGKRESGTAYLKEAVLAYCAALQERTRERVPQDWAATQNRLGDALTVLGQRESGTMRLNDAVVAYRAALEVFTPENARGRNVQASLDEVAKLILDRERV